MENRIMISVVVPLYNKEMYVERTILSILSQTYECFEVIVVDDGSTDNSCEVVKRIKDRRIRLFCKENGGVSDARNYGVDHASYPYIAFIDGDDWWNPLFLEKMCSLINGYPEASIYGSSYAEINGDTVIPLRAFGVLPRGEQLVDYIDGIARYRSFLINSSSVIVKRDILLQERFNINIVSGEDVMMWLQIGEKHKLAYVNEILSYYNKNVPDSRTRELTPIRNHMVYHLRTCFTNPSEGLEAIMDSLITNALLPYYQLNLFPSEVDEILSGVNISKLRMIPYIYYKLPRPVARFVYRMITKIYKKDYYV